MPHARVYYPAALPQPVAERHSRPVSMRIAHLHGALRLPVSQTRSFEPHLSSNKQRANFNSTGLLSAFDQRQGLHNSAERSSQRQSVGRDNSHSLTSMVRKSVHNRRGHCRQQRGRTCSTSSRSFACCSHACPQHEDTGSRFMEASRWLCSCQSCSYAPPQVAPVAPAKRVSSSSVRVWPLDTHAHSAFLQRKRRLPRHPSASA